MTEPENCPSCGYRVPPSVARCPSCGTARQGASDGPDSTEQVPTLPAWAEGVRPDALPAWATPGAPNADEQPAAVSPPPPGWAPAAGAPAPPPPAWPPPPEWPAQTPPPQGPPTQGAPTQGAPTQGAPTQGVPPPPGWPPPQPAQGWPPPAGPAGWPPQPQWGGPWPQQGPYAPAPGPRTDGVAIAALIAGGVSLLLFFLFLPAIAAIVLGLVGLARVHSSSGMRKGRGLAVTGAVLGVVSIIGGVVAIVGLNRTGVFSGNLVAYSRLQIGDCFNEPGVLPLYRRVACGSPHDREVYGRVLDPSPSDSSFPGALNLQAEARQGCASQLESYLGPTPNRALYLISSITPSQTSWDRGERVLVCILKSATGSRLTGSARAGLS